ncbi:glycine-rich RNA-binding protein 3, mitochondrial [Quercus suber]|uniref:glycine-rich RNA-binding protein 3, mitochondrial n=1 Tax=Quercus suber TaxID=58331 RepID=UPI0032DE5912
MAFLSKVGNLLRQTASKQISSEFGASKPSFFQAIRCMSSMSSSKLFIEGLSYGTDDQSLKEAFAKYGEVAEARIIMDRETGRSSGFGFVTYVSSEEASSAIQALDGQDLHGRRVRVTYATDRARPSYGDSGYSGGGVGYSSSGNYASGNSGGYGNTGGNFDVSGGSGNFASRDGSKIAGSGFEGSTGQGFGGADQFGTSESSCGDGGDASLEGNFRDDEDETGDFAKRA